jgi:ketosteroid isomerase-like protein
MTDRHQVTQWLNDYIEAWKSYERDAIAALFSEDAVYRYNPFDAPLRGREAIIADWLENPDPPGSFTAEYHPVAVEGDTAVANGRTIYYETDGRTIRTQFDNIFVLRFDADGRCSDFCEWFVQPR